VVPGKNLPDHTCQPGARLNFHASVGLIIIFVHSSSDWPLRGQSEVSRETGTNSGQAAVSADNLRTDIYRKVGMRLEASGL
jgi:hypothetical protein